VKKVVGGLGGGGESKEEKALSESCSDAFGCPRISNRGQF